MPFHVPNNEMIPYQSRIPNNQNFFPTQHNRYNMHFLEEINRNQPQNFPQIQGGNMTGLIPKFDKLYPMNYNRPVEMIDTLTPEQLRLKQNLGVPNINPIKEEDKKESILENNNKEDKKSNIKQEVKEDIKLEIKKEIKQENEDSDSEEAQFNNDTKNNGDNEDKDKEEENDEILSELNDSEEEAADPETDDYLLAQYEKVHRVKTKWKVIFKDAILHCNGKEMVFEKVTGELDRDW